MPKPLVYDLDNETMNGLVTYGYRPALGSIDDFLDDQFENHYKLGMINEGSGWLSKDVVEGIYREQYVFYDHVEGYCFAIDQRKVLIGKEEIQALIVGETKDPLYYGATIAIAVEKPLLADAELALWKFRLKLLPTSKPQMENQKQRSESLLRHLFAKYEEYQEFGTS